MSSDSSEQQPAKRKVGGKKPPWNWVEATLLGLLALIGADVAVSVLLGVVGGLSENLPFADGSISQLIESQSVSFNFFIYAISRLLGLGIIILFIRRRNITIKQFGFKKFSLFKAIKYILAASGLMLALTILVFLILGQLAPNIDLEQEQQIVFTAASGRLEIIMAFIALVIIAPIVEEAIFRGLMLPVFVRRFGLIVGSILVSVAFGAVHWQLNVSIVTFIMGLLLAWIYYKTRSLWPAIMFHSLKNLVAFILIF